MATKGGTPPTQPPTTDVTKTGGGGGGGDGQPTGSQTDAPVVLGDDEAPIIKSRKEFVTAGADKPSRLGNFEWSFDPGSLLGSWFLVPEGGEIVFQGVIVGQLASPTRGVVYLVQMDRLEAGAEQVQVLRSFDQMVEDEWRFYDSENEARSAYAKWVATERERM